MKCIIIILLVSIFPLFKCYSQSENVIYLELLGNGGRYSINYEKSLIETFKFRFGVAHWSQKIGAVPGVVVKESKRTTTTIPVLFSMVSRAPVHHFEVGIGGTFGFTNKREDNRIISASSFIGYRFQKRKTGLLLRAGFTPFYGFEGDFPDKGLFLSGGLSVGYHF